AGLEVSRQYLEEIDPKNLELLKSRGMILVPESDIDMKAFKAAGEAAYVKLNLQAARDRVYAEMGKSK
ncbi:MAG: C4-dicarboxylate ABC transporter, partial [Sphaerochaetaceae bacterium]|nr:C4-dicarboxylate ABC transporter [Sphaerochaetaceae bacterium]